MVSFLAMLLYHISYHRLAPRKGLCSFCHSWAAQASSWSASPLNCPCTHVGCLLCGSQAITMTTTLPTGLTCRVQTRVLPYWGGGRKDSSGSVYYSGPHICFQVRFHQIQLPFRKMFYTYDPLTEYLLWLFCFWCWGSNQEPHIWFRWKVK